MSEKYHEPETVRSAMTRTIEQNIEWIESALRMADQWQPIPGGEGVTATVGFFLTDTGHVCFEDDPHVMVRCVSTFIRVGEKVRCENTDVFSMPQGPSQISDEVWTILAQTVDTVAEQIEPFPRLIPATPMSTIPKSTH